MHTNYLGRLFQAASSSLRSSCYTIELHPLAVLSRGQGAKNLQAEFGCGYSEFQFGDFLAASRPSLRWRTDQGAQLKADIGIRWKTGIFSKITSRLKAQSRQCINVFKRSL